MRFELTHEENDLLSEWLGTHNNDKDCRFSIPNGSKTGAIGGSYTYLFTPTSLGIAKKVECACGIKFDYTDYDLW